MDLEFPGRGEDKMGGESKAEREIDKSIKGVTGNSQDKFYHSHT